jgi:hypothetical protein
MKINDKGTYIFRRKPKGKRPLGRHKGGVEYNTEYEFKERGCGLNSCGSTQKASRSTPSMFSERKR